MLQLCCLYTQIFPDVIELNKALAKNTQSKVLTSLLKKNKHLRNLRVKSKKTPGIADASDIGCTVLAMQYGQQVRHRL